VVLHDGAGPGISSMIALVPDLNVVVTLQSNADMKHIANNLVFAEILAAIEASNMITVPDAGTKISDT
jgi:hypothetical protein